MFRNKQALQSRVFSGAAALHIPGPARRTSDLSSRKSTLSQDFSKPPHFVRLSVRPSDCLPASLLRSHSPLPLYLCQLEDAQPDCVCETAGDPAMRGQGPAGEKPVSTVPNIVHFPLKTPSSFLFHRRRRPLSSSPFSPSLLRSPFFLLLPGHSPISIHSRSIDRSNGGGGDGICRAHNSLDVAAGNEIEIGQLIGVLKQTTTG